MLQDTLRTAASRTTAGYPRFLDASIRANPTGDPILIGENLSTHEGAPIAA
jgi:hypothetical protein